MRVAAINTHAMGYKNRVNKPQKNNKYISFTSVDQIFKYEQVDETLHRGSRPRPEQLSDLKKIGISTIIDLTTEPSRIVGYSEESSARELGMKYVKIPVVSDTNPSDDQVKLFFREIESAKNNNQQVYLHCLEGKDRTGLFVEMYKIKYGLSDAQTSINTLIKNRYKFSENPLAARLLKDFEAECKSQ